METNTAKMARTDQGQVPEPGIDDRLSSLPDEIITGILSFLETKYAVGTAVLSRRWTDLWTGVSNLDFDSRLVYRDLISSGDVDNLLLEEMKERRGLEFSRFVDRVLSQHRILDSVRRFRLHFFALSKTYCKVMSGYLDKLGSSQVEEIDIRQFGYRFIWLPESFYTLKNVKVVKLHGGIMISNGSVSLPSLKIFQLQKVRIKDYESLGRLISGCPVLETLHLEDCYVKFEDCNEEYKLIASLSSLRNLSIIDRDHECLCPIAIEAPNLEHLYLAGFLELQFLGSSHLPCIHSVLVESFWDSNDSERQCLIELLTQVSNAKDLGLTSRTIELLQNMEDIQLPVFPNLTHLTIELCHCPFWFLHSLLHSVPKLQSLVVKPMSCDTEPMMSIETEPTYTWQGLLSSLKKTKIEDFVLYKNNVKMVGYLLDAGSVLKEVDIHILDDITKRSKRKKLVSLLTLRRESSACDVRLLHRRSEIGITLDDDEINTDNKYDIDMDDEDDEEEKDEDKDEDKEEDEN